MIGRIAVAQQHRERSAEESLAHDKELLNIRVQETAAAKRHEASLSLENRWPPTYVYLFLGNVCNIVTTHPYFENFILFCIIVASVLVGVEQYPEMGGDTLYYLESIVMHAFIVEAFLKIIAEGDSPWYYFLGNEGRWNTFDFTIVLLANPYIKFSDETEGVQIFRLVRLMRLVKVFRRIPQLRMILMGLVGGLKSIVYIVVLMALTFYLYGLIGMIALKDNDPWHFNSIAVSMLTLLRVATLDGWGKIFYISYLGCDAMSVADDYYYTDISQLGDVWPPDGSCDDDDDDDDIKCITSYKGFGHAGEILECKPNPKPVVTSLYYISFIIIASFCMLSLFVGAVTMSMSESMEKMQDEKEASRKAERRAQLVTEIDRLKDIDVIERRTRMQVTLLRQAFTGQILDPNEEAHLQQVSYTERPILQHFKQFCRVCGTIVDNTSWQRFVTAAIIMVGIMLGLDTFSWMEKMKVVDVNGTEFHWWFIIDLTILITFWVEHALVIASEEFRLYHVYKYGQNCFDAFVLIMEQVPTGADVLILRLLKMLRVLKLMRAFPDLQVIISALMNGISSIGFISVLLGIFFFFFGVIGKICFELNDPWHFGSLHMSIITLFQLATLDDWTIVEYINLYGCDVYGGGYYEGGMHCEPYANRNVQFAVAALYFTLFILVGALVLFTLFIGVVSMSFEEAQDEQKVEHEVEKRVDQFVAIHGTSDVDLAYYREVFALVDFTRSKQIGKEELRFGLKLAEMDISEVQFELLWSRLDKDSSDGVDMAEFLDFMIALRGEISGNVVPEQTNQRSSMFEEAKPKPVPHKHGTHHHATHRVAPLDVDEEDVVDSFVMTSPSFVNRTGKGFSDGRDAEGSGLKTRKPHVRSATDERNRTFPRSPVGQGASGLRMTNQHVHHSNMRPDEDEDFLETHVAKSAINGHPTDRESSAHLNARNSESDTAAPGSPSDIRSREAAVQVVQTVQRQVEQLTRAAQEQMEHYHAHQQAALEVELANLENIKGDNASTGSPVKQSPATRDAMRRIALKAQDVAETAVSLAKKAAAVLDHASAGSDVMLALSPEHRVMVAKDLDPMTASVSEIVRSTAVAAGEATGGISPTADHWLNYVAARADSRAAPLDGAESAAKSK